jgi:hypothetical protein
MLLILVALALWWRRGRVLTLVPASAVAPAIASLEVVPATTTLPPNGTQQFTATARALDGTVKSASVTWSATGGAVTVAGVYTAGTTAGAFKVIATTGGGLSDVATVEVTDAPSVAAGRDRIVLYDNRKLSAGYAGDETVVLVDGDLRLVPTVPMCLNDDRAPADLSYANLWSSSCTVSGGSATRPDEIAVLSVDDALEIKSGVPGLWKDATDESVDVFLQEPVRLPLVFWIVASTTDTCPALVAAYQCDLQQAAALYGLQRAGLNIVADEVPVVSGAAAAKIGAGCEAHVESTSYYRATSINVYYVAGIPGTATALTCAPMAGYTNFGNVIYIDANLRKQTTLSHELGHVLGLLEAGGPGGSNYSTVPGEEFTESNVMWQGGILQNELRLGQVFRVNVYPFSFVNHFPGLRTGPRRDCEPHPWIPPATYAEHNAGQKQDGDCPRMSRPW